MASRTRVQRRVARLEAELEQLGRDKAELHKLTAARDRLSAMVGTDASVDDLTAAVRAMVLPLDLRRAGPSLQGWQRRVIKAAGLDRPGRMLALDGAAQMLALEEVLRDGC